MIKNKNLFDVIIIGAGPAGALSAIQFAEKGFRTLMIDARKTTVRKLCGEYLCPRGVALLRNLKLDHLLDKSEVLTGMRIFSPDGKEVFTTFPGAEKGAVGYSVNREQFDQTLVDLARDAGVTVQFDEALVGLKQEGPLWSIETKKGSYKARLLVGADGRKSLVSKHLQNDLPAKDKRLALHAYLPSKEKNLRKGEMHILNDGSYVGLNPIDDTEMNISIVCDGATVRKYGGAENAFKVILQKSENLWRRFGEQLEGAPIYAVSPITHKTKGQIGPQVALVGDAAGFIDPLTGEGIFHALQTAWSLTQTIDHEAIFEPSRLQAALHAYQVTYREMFADKQSLNRAFQAIIRRPWVVNTLGRFFRSRKHRGDVFVGVIGNIYTPKQGLIKLFQEVA